MVIKTTTNRQRIVLNSHKYARYQKCALQYQTTNGGKMQPKKGRDILLPLGKNKKFLSI